MLNQNEILKSLEKIRPYLQEDDGDVELVKFTDDGIVFVKFLGACKVCPINQMTLRAGIENALKKDIPEVKRIEEIRY